MRDELNFQTLLRELGNYPDKAVESRNRDQKKDRARRQPSRHSFQNNANQIAYNNTDRGQKIIIIM